MGRGRLPLKERVKEPNLNFKVRTLTARLLDVELAADSTIDDLAEHLEETEGVEANRYSSTWKLSGDAKQIEKGALMRNLPKTLHMMLALMEYSSSYNSRAPRTSLIPALGYFAASDDLDVCATCFDRSSKTAQKTWQTHGCVAFSTIEERGVHDLCDVYCDICMTNFAPWTKAKILIEMLKQQKQKEKKINAQDLARASYTFPYDFDLTTLREEILASGSDPELTTEIIAELVQLKSEEDAARAKSGTSSVVDASSSTSSAAFSVFQSDSTPPEAVALVEAAALSSTTTDGATSIGTGSEEEVKKAAHGLI